MLPVAHLVDNSIVDDALGAGGEAQRGVRLVRMLRRGRHIADDGGLGVAAQRRLQDTRQLAIPVGNMPAYATTQESLENHHTLLFLWIVNI